MSTAKKILYKLIEEIPESQIPEVIDYISFLKSKKNRETFQDLTSADESSIEFWDNDIDDTVWNNVLCCKVKTLTKGH